MQTNHIMEKYIVVLKGLFLAAMLMFLYTSCDKDNEIGLGNLDSNYLVFGGFAGECFGDMCVTNFALTDDGLFEDENHVYNSTDFSFVELTNDKYELAKDLIDFFPQQLLEQEESTIGCPDCYDQGGYFIQYTQDGESQFWRIDTRLEDVPTYLHDFLGKVSEKINLLKM